MCIIQKARLARIRLAKGAAGAAFANRKKAAEARLAAQESGIELDENYNDDDIFELQHHHLLRCLEKTTVSEAAFCASTIVFVVLVSCAPVTADLLLKGNERSIINYGMSRRKTPRRDAYTRDDSTKLKHATSLLLNQVFFFGSFYFVVFEVAFKLMINQTMCSVRQLD